MRTTRGKTKATRRAARRIEVWEGREYVCTRWASSLRQALLEFAKERYPDAERFGIGNTMLIGDREFTARDARP